MDNIDEKRHSLSHLLAMAVLEKFPKAKLGIGPTIENGFYYDFALPAEETTCRNSKTSSQRLNWEYLKGWRK